MSDRSPVWISVIPAETMKTGSRYDYRAGNSLENFVAKDDNNGHFLLLKHMKKRASEVAKYFFKLPNY